MIPTGTLYGVALNDRRECEAMAAAFLEKPYVAPPQAPILYIKPRPCFASSGTAVVMPEGVTLLIAAPTVALIFARDACKVDERSALDAVGATCLALDISVGGTGYYRPGLAERCRDGFLPLGKAADPALPDEIVTHVDGIPAHRWSLGRLARSTSALIAELSMFMTLKAGDGLLIGLPGDAPQVRIGQSITVTGGALPALSVTISGENG